MKKTLFLFVLSGLFAARLMSQEVVTEELYPEDFWNEYQLEAFALIIDVRTKIEKKKGMIPGALEAPNKKSLEMMADSLDRETPLFIYCHTQTRAGSAAEFLSGMEFTNLHILKGGMAEWKNREMPLEKWKKRQKTKGKR